MCQKNHYKKGRFCLDYLDSTPHYLTVPIKVPKERTFTMADADKRIPASENTTKFAQTKLAEIRDGWKDDKSSFPGLKEAIKAGHVVEESYDVEKTNPKTGAKHFVPFKRFIAKNAHGALALSGGNQETMFSLISDAFNAQQKPGVYQKLSAEVAGPEKYIESMAKVLCKALGWDKDNEEKLAAAKAIVAQNLKEAEATA